VDRAALEVALDLVGRRPHFREELRRKLLARGHGEDEVAAALDRMTELGYLDDAELAVREAERLRERRGLGRAGISAELGRKGAARAAVDGALSGVDGEQELAAARAVAERWLAGRRRDPAALARHLDRKGYARHVIFSVLKELVPDAPGDPDAG
jgi:regulatory protein